MPYPSGIKNHRNEHPFQEMTFSNSERNKKLFQPSVQSDK